MTNRALFAHGYGEPARVGEQIGQRLRQPINQVIHSLGIPSALENSPGLAEMVDQLVASLSAVAPGLVEEMDGLAQGAQVPAEWIYALNCAPEISEPRCSLVAFLDTPGGPMVGKNLDLPPSNPPQIAVCAEEMGSGHQVLRADWPGVVGGDGVSARGLAIATAYVPTTERPADDAIPAAAVTRILLDRAATVDEAAEILSELSPASAMNIVVADSEQVLVAERSLHKLSIRRADDATICATNHFLNPDLAELNPAGPQIEESRRRLARLQEIAASAERSRSGLLAVLADHGQPPICRHSEAAERTVAAMLLKPVARVMWFAAGPPCTAPARPFQLKLPVTASGGIVGYAT